MEKVQHAEGSVPPRARPASGQLSHKRRVLTLGSAILAMTWLACLSVSENPFPFLQRTTSSAFDKAQQCAIDNLHKDLSFLDQAKPITADEFVGRRDRLAQALAASEVDAFVLEPGYTFQYVVASTAQNAYKYPLADSNPDTMETSHRQTGSPGSLRSDPFSCLCCQRHLGMAMSGPRRPSCRHISKKVASECLVSPAETTSLTS